MCDGSCINSVPGHRLHHGEMNTASLAWPACNLLQNLSCNPLHAPGLDHDI